MNVDEKSIMATVETVLKMFNQEMALQKLWRFSYRKKKIYIIYMLNLYISFNYRQGLFAHSVCANFVNVHSECANFDVNAHSICKFWLKCTEYV